MSLIYDTIKIKLLHDGYLPNYPYHLISDAEMCDGFMSTKAVTAEVQADGTWRVPFDVTLTMQYAGITASSDVDTIHAGDRYISGTGDPGTAVEVYYGYGYFYDTYPCLDPSIGPQYADLLSAIRYYLNELKAAGTSSYKLPAWICSYMLGSVISIHSDPLDIHDLITPLGVDNIGDEFGPEQSVACYNRSVTWLSRVSNKAVIQVEVASANGPPTYSTLNLRPATMFGEPHIIKANRVDSLDPLK